MSYAEQLFGVKENRAIEFATDLAWFGTNSVVYNDTEMMQEVLECPEAQKNPIANYYIYKYVREHGLDVQTYIPLGFKIGMYNKDYGFVINFMLFSYESGYCKFISDYSAGPFGLSWSPVGTNGSTILNMEDYTFIQFFNGSIKEWHKEWNEFYAPVDHDYYMDKIMITMPGFLHGFSEDVKEDLKPIKSNIGSKNLKTYFCFPTTAELNTIINTMNGIYNAGTTLNVVTALGRVHESPYYKRMAKRFTEQGIKLNLGSNASFVTFTTLINNPLKTQGIVMAMTELEELRNDLPTNERAGIRNYVNVAYADLVPDSGNGALFLLNSSEIQLSHLVIRM
jgi:hypothetical protein